MSFNKRKRYLLQLLATTMLVTLLTACGSSNVESTPPATETTTPVNNVEVEESTLRTLTDPLGHEVIIPANPQRVIASYLEDYLVTLDVQPVAQWAIGESPMMYLQSELASIPFIPFDLPFEVVTSFSPDLIIIGDESLIASDKYSSYNKIASTYALGSEINSNWRQSLLTIGEVLNKSEEAQAALDQYEAKVTDAKTKLASALEAQESVTAIWLVGKTFWMVNDKQSSGDVLYNDLGFAVPKLVQTISEGDSGVWRSVSLEALSELDADHIFLINSDTATGSEALQDPVWKEIPAVKNNRIYEFGPETSWLYTGPIANNQMIDHVLESLLQ